MTRLSRLVISLGLTGGLGAAIIAACGSHPGSPGEMPPVAPRPEPADPSARPMPGALGTPSGTLDAGTTRAPGATAPLAAVTPASVMPVPEYAPIVGEGLDAGPSDGASDGYSPPMVPLPDGNLPADSRLEPTRSN